MAKRPDRPAHRALSPNEFALARLTLMRRDPRLGALIKKVGPCLLSEARTRQPFAALVRALIAQQLSGKAAATIHDRVAALVGGIEGFAPAALLALNPA